jgi:hypothetical protein
MNMKDVDNMYKTQRFCNTIKVYKRFCKQAGMQNWQYRKSLEDMTKLTDDINPIKQKIPSVDFTKQIHRRDISYSYPSANESRFKKTHSAMLSDKPC